MDLAQDKRKRMRQRQAIDAILKEREYQRQRWSDDQRKTMVQWIGILAVYVGKAAQETPLYRENALESFRKRIVQIGAICAAILEETDGRGEEQK